MKKFAGILLLFVASFTMAQAPYNWEEHKSPDGRFTYKTVSNDPLGVRIYTLPNGLTVMLSVNKSEPRIQTYIATKAGSKNDPADNTGLAHYLEHMLFKGTDKYGTKDWAKEKEQLDKIDALYEQYNKTTNPDQRKVVYHKIDSVSGEASKYAIANEYDKMLANIGASGTNAFTSLEQTVYVNEIPQNQVENFLTIEAERFRAPVLRLFHTELEAVYEEKNIALDNDGRKVMEALLSNLFTNHAYGTQTTIGTVEHLKNPSLIKIRNYYNTYYVPNNMAIIMAGDLDPDKTISLIAEKFAYMQPKPVPVYTFQPEPARTAPAVINIYGPDAENIMIGFRMPGATTKEARYVALIDYLLANSEAGLIDLNLVKQQKVLAGGSQVWTNKDYSIHFLTGKPLQGQSLDEVRSLLLSQLEKIKAGDFTEEDLKAIISNFKVGQIRNNESNEGRAYTMLDAFVVSMPWTQAASMLDDLSKITKQELVAFANKAYTNDYVVVNKNVGEDKGTAKVPKPEITPVEVNRDDVSPFVQKIIESTPQRIAPKYLDFKNDVTRTTTASGLPVYYIRNKENGLFTMYYVLDMGKFHNIKLPVAVQLLQYLGTDKYTAEQISKEFFKLACSFDVSAGDEQVYVSLTGLDENFEPAVKLFEHLLANAKPDQQALGQLVERMLKQRKDVKMNKNAIFRTALRNYAYYGKNNPFTYILKEDELKALKADELVGMIKGLTSYKHAVYYYGPREADALKNTLAKEHKVAKKLKDYPVPVQFTRSQTSKNQVYFVNYKMVQAEILWLNRQPQAYDTTMYPVVTMFNEYFGGGMSSVVFQTIRESKALAYSTYSVYITPTKKADPYYINAYVGTQADKINDAIPAMQDLLTTLPKADANFASAREAVMQQIETQRINKERVFFSLMGAEKLGLHHDISQDIYEGVSKLTFDDINTFYNNHYKSNKYTYCIMGSKEKLSMDDLKKYGEVTELTLEDIFGY
jgi:predicted Zn-dependent peptidase